MLKKITIVITIALLAIGYLAVWINSGQANEPFCRYHYLTNFEVTRFNEMIWFWHRDSLWGRVHSNDLIGIKYSPHFYGQLSTSRDEFRRFQAGPHFEYPPQFGAPIRRFPQDFSEARDEGLVIGEPDGVLQYRLILDENTAILWAWSRGMPFREIDSLRQEIDIEENPIVFIDSPLELMGVLDGVLTVGCSHDIKLIDDVRYISGDNRGRFDPDECEDMLGVVAEGNIIIANTVANGRENGWDRGNRPDDMDRHSIILDGAFIALDESFTFEHQNDDFDAYQGPEQDERGFIHLTGSVTQWRKGYMHRSNHQGTGYGKVYRYDPRFEDQSPPMFPEVVRYDIPGNGNWLDLKRENSPYHLIGSGDYDSIRAEAGTEIILHEDYYLEATELLILEGTEEAPIVLTRENADEVDSLMVGLLCDNHRAEIVLRYVERGRGVALELHGSQIIVENCEFYEKVSLNHEVESELEITESKFHNGLSISGRFFLHLSHSVIENGAWLSLNTGFVNIINNNFLHSDSAGLNINVPRQITTVNNIFAHNRYGFIAGTDNEEVVTYPYNCYWDNDTNRIGVDPGEGSIHADPRFVDPDNGDYHLQWNSPCIDAGDPISPHDPDGTRADIGAFYRDRNLIVSDAPTVPDQFTVTASPNPFNSMVNLHFELPHSNRVTLTVFDLTGREIYSITDRFSVGNGKMMVNGKVLGGAGVFFARISSGDLVETVKLVYVP